VVDEAQDLSPMQLRMLERRSLNGSMTVVGDIAQATGVWAHKDWDEILEHLPQRRPGQRAELTIGYRIPGPTMDLAAKVLAVAAPDLRPPSSVREAGDEPRIVAVDEPADLAARVAAVAAEERDAVDPGSVAVIVASTQVDDVAAALDVAGIEFGRAARNGLESRVTLVPVSLVKGLELDAAVVVEPAAIVDEEAQGMRALYVALTRATKRLAVVHARPLPAPLR
jgi:DNA helicase IV